MIKRFCLLTACVMMSLLVSAQIDYNIIPLPDAIEISTKGEVYNLTNGAVVSYPAGNEQMQNNAQMLCEYLQETTKLDLIAKGDFGKGAAITLQTGLNNDNIEAYALTIDKKGITITGASENGVFYGIQTLRKAIGITQGDTIALPYVKITDQPRFGYRGSLIDCARHFFSIDFLKKYIDILALHGCNYLHWHLTDDQGWRFEVKAIPELTERGSIRAQTVIGPNCGIYDGQEYGRSMYYTQEQCRELIDYAAKRYITIIPEIDLPGHMLAALHVRPDLGCTGGPYDVCTAWYISKDVLCAGNPATLDFLKVVLGEVAEVFPSKMIHIGGDEAPRQRWEECPKCQAKMQELGLSRESELQTYINKELEAFLKERGRTIIGWDETLDGGLSDEAIVMSWRGSDGGIAAAQQHHKVIMTPNTHCYFDYYQLEDRNIQPRAIGGYLPISKVYDMTPVPEVLTEEEQQYILGPQCNLWTEYISAPEHMEYMLLPRLSALCEVQWMRAEKKDFETFNARLPRMLQLYQALGYKYCPKME